MNFIHEVHPAGPAELFKFVPDEFVGILACNGWFRA